jgi:AcrR family transcriptional regulator
VSRADRSRAQLIDAALTCFSRDGLEGTSIRDIAELAGQNTASISYHFGSKENLYHSVLAETMRLIRAVGEEVVSEIGRLEDTQSMTPAAAINLLQRFFATVFRALIEDDNGIRIAPLIVREQIRPTPTFDLIYEEGIHQNHKMLSRLVGIATNVPAGDPRTILRAHSLLGQFKVLITARETILRRLGWKDFKGETRMRRSR